jgi:acyl carrier protein
VTSSSSLGDHGLDSLDAIEIAMQIEEDLGYQISAETLPAFTKVSHYIKYIDQV